MLEEYGNKVRMPRSEQLQDGIFQIRAQQEGKISRVLYFFTVGKTIVLTNGFSKKTPRMPPAEIELAKNIGQTICGRRAAHWRNQRAALFPAGFEIVDILLHPVRAAALHRLVDVAVYVQRKGRRSVAKAALHRFDVIAGTDGGHGVGVPLWQNKDKSENLCVATGWLGCPYSFSTNFPAKKRA